MVLTKKQKDTLKKVVEYEQGNFSYNFRDYEYHWVLTNTGFKVFTIDYFDTDIKKHLKFLATKYKLKINKIDNSNWELYK